MTKLRVALVHPFSWPDVRRGGERYLADIAWFLATDGHDVDVITGTDGDSSTAIEGGVRFRRRHHVMAHRLQRRGLSRSDTFGIAALPVLMRHRYDVVHCLVPSAAAAARVAGQRPIYTLLGHPTPDQFGVRPFDRQILAAGARFAREMTVLSEASARACEAMIGGHPRVLTPGVRVADFAPRLAARTGPLRILFSADAADGRKNGALLVRAFAEVLRREPDARLQHSGAGSLDPAIAGLGVDADSVRAAVDQLGIGELSDVPGRYRDATVTVLPARHEAFGLAVVESLACGTPAVCADDGGPPELLDDPRVGRIAPLDDAPALAAAILDAGALARDPATPKRCVEHAMKWDWQTSVGPAHVRLYRGVARRPKAPR